MRYWKLLNSLTLSDPVIWVLQNKCVMDWVLTCQTSCLNLLFRKLAKVSTFVWRNQLIRAIIPKSIVSAYVCIHVHVGQARACLCMCVCVCLIDMYTCTCDCRYTSVCRSQRLASDPLSLPPHFPPYLLSKLSHLELTSSARLQDVQAPGVLLSHKCVDAELGSELPTSRLQASAALAGSSPTPYF